MSTTQPPPHYELTDEEWAEFLDMIGSQRPTTPPTVDEVAAYMQAPPMQIVVAYRQLPSECSEASTQPGSLQGYGPEH